MPNVITSLSTCGTTLQGNIMQRESHVAQARQQGKLSWEAASPSLPLTRRLRGSPPVRPSVPPPPAQAISRSTHMCSPARTDCPTARPPSRVANCQVAVVAAVARLACAPGFARHAAEEGGKGNGAGRKGRMILSTQWLVVKYPE